MGIHYQRGSALYDLHRYREAIEEFTKDLADEPNSPYAFAMRGASLINLRRSNEAEDDVRTAIALAPEFSYAHYLLSIIYMNRGRRRAAEKSIREALRLDANAQNYHQLGRIYFNAVRNDDCLKATDSALELDPYHEPSIVLRAKTLARMGRLKEARDILREMLARDAQSPDLHRELGTVTLQVGTAKEALDHLLEARRIDPIEHNDRLTLAIAYGRMLWPLNKVDAFLTWLWQPSIVQHWFVRNVTATVLLLTLLILKPDDGNFSLMAALVFAFVANVLVLKITFELFARQAAMIRLKRDLGLRWYDYFASIFDITIILLANGLATLAAGSLTFAPAFYFLILSLIVLGWDFVGAAAHFHWLLKVSLVPLVAIGMFVFSLTGAIYMPDQPRLILAMWAVAILLSIPTMFLRLKLEAPSTRRRVLEFAAP